MGGEHPVSTGEGIAMGLLEAEDLKEEQSHGRTGGTSTPHEGAGKVGTSVDTAHPSPFYGAMRKGAAANRGARVWGGLGGSRETTLLTHCTSRASREQPIL